jgi:hypothetical protein
MWLGVGLTTVILLLVLFVPCPSTTQYFVFRIIIALAAAGLASVIPGVLKLHVRSGITAGGALAVFVSIYFFDPASSIGEARCNDGTFVFTVFVHGKSGKEDKILKGQGEVCLYLNSRPEKAKIDDDGRATFTEISPTFLAKRVRITIDHPQPYQSTHVDSLYLLERDGVAYVETELQGMEKIFGEVLDFQTGMLMDSVRVSIYDIESYTNKNGWFQLDIPADKQAKFQRVAFDKKGFQREVYDSVPVHTRQPFSVTMKRNAN